jgi:hypothetical protein
MSQYLDGPHKTLVAAAAIALYLRVGHNSSGQAYLAGVGDIGIGTVLSPSLAANESLSVRLFNAAGTHKMVASGAITRDSLVYAAAGGKVSASGTLCLGYALETSTADNDVIEVLPLMPDPSTVRSVRTRFTIAEINAGATLLPAVPGKRYRIVDMALISIGGAAATATSVDIRATQSASSVNLLAAAVAGLTQNTLLRAGATNAAILAGGASFVQNDVNTAVTIAKTGSNVATATHVDALVQYVLE